MNVTRQKELARKKTGELLVKKAYPKYFEDLERRSNDFAKEALKENQ